MDVRAKVATAQFPALMGAVFCFKKTGQQFEHGMKEGTHAEKSHE